MYRLIELTQNIATASPGPTSRFAGVQGVQHATDRDRRCCRPSARCASLQEQSRSLCRICSFQSEGSELMDTTKRPGLTLVVVVEVQPQWASSHFIPARLVYGLLAIPRRSRRYGGVLGRIADSRGRGAVRPNNRRIGRCIPTPGPYDDVTYRICQLTDTQKGALLCFLRAEKPEERGGASPLPILPDETNTARVDPEEPFSATGVCRNSWEREMPPPESMGDGRASCVFDRLNFLTLADQEEAMGRWRDRGDRL